MAHEKWKQEREKTKWWLLEFARLLTISIWHHSPHLLLHGFYSRKLGCCCSMPLLLCQTAHISPSLSHSLAHHPGWQASLLTSDYIMKKVCRWGNKIEELKNFWPYILYVPANPFLHSPSALLLPRLALLP